MKSLSKEASRRYASADELGKELQRYLEGEPIHARPVSKLERGWRWCKRNRVVAALATAVAITLVAGTAISSYFAIEASYRALREADGHTVAGQSRDHDARCTPWW